MEDCQAWWAVELKEVWKDEVVVELVPMVAVEVVGEWSLVQLEVRYELECLRGVVQLLVQESHDDRLHVVVVGHVGHGRRKRCLPEDQHSFSARFHQ